MELIHNYRRARGFDFLENSQQSCPSFSLNFLATHEPLPLEKTKCFYSQESTTVHFQSLASVKCKCCYSQKKYNDSFNVKLCYQNVSKCAKMCQGNFCGAFSHDVTAVMLVSHANPVGFEVLSYVNASSCFNKFA